MIQIHHLGAAEAQTSCVLCVSVSVCSTLCADQDQRQVGRVSVVGEAAEVVINRLEADLVLQTEDEDDGVHPQRELQRHGFKCDFIDTRQRPVRTGTHTRTVCNYFKENGGGVILKGGRQSELFRSRLVSCV